MNILACMIVAPVILIFIIYRWGQARKLNEYLLKNGVEIDADARLILYGGSFFIVEVSFQINGQVVRRQLTLTQFDYFPLQPKRNIVKKFPVLVDPVDPRRFLFNVRKFQLTKTSDDSVKNFLERNNAEHPDASSRGTDTSF